VEKTKQLYVLLALIDYYYVTRSFDLWMSKGAYDIFRGWLATKTHCNWFFETSDTFRHALAKDLIELLDKYDLRKKIIIYVKDEGSNLHIMIIALKFVINCDIYSFDIKFSR
jgi:hypothetical protein